LIYIDGSHSPEQAVQDLKNSDLVLKEGGVLWIDDFGADYMLNGTRLSDSIADWVSNNRSRYEVIHEGYQIGLMKNCPA
jgi:hypothetical protein